MLSFNATHALHEANEHIPRMAFLKVQAAFLKKLVQANQALPTDDRRWQSCEDLQAIALAPDLKVGLDMREQDAETLADYLLQAYQAFYAEYDAAGFPNPAAAARGAMRAYKVTV
jgi:hypothetical protein